MDFVKHIRNTKELAIQEQTALEFTAETYETEKIDNEVKYNFVLQTYEVRLNV